MGQNCVPGMDFRGSYRHGFLRVTACTFHTAIANRRVYGRAEG